MRTNLTKMTHRGKTRISQKEIESMYNREIGPQTLYRELNQYLTSTSLSLSQIARNLGVSKGHLSEIKNGKADPALNTGLRILKLCGLDLEERKAWAHFYNRSISDEYLEVHAEVDEIYGQKLNEKISFRLAHDLDFLNAYTDIINKFNAGVALIELKNEYGNEIEKKLDSFVHLGILAKVDTDQGKVYRAGEVSPIVSKNASFYLIRTIIEQQHINFQNGEYEGMNKFFFNDVDDQGVKELDQLMKDMMDRATDIIRAHHRPRTEGGNRYIFQAMLGRCKS